MDRETCSTPLTVHGTVSPKSPSRSLTGSPVDDKTSVLTPVDRASPEPNCAICLGKLQNKSFTNSCLHQYCFTCLLEWSKVKAECPLCKQSFQSIIHNVRSIEDYDQYDLLPNETAAAPTATTTVSVTASYHWTLRDMPRFRYRTTMTGNNGRFRIEEVNPVVLQPLPPARRPQRAPWTRSRRQIATAEFRRSIYERNLWVMPLHDITGRYRESSPEFYRNNPAQLHRLLPWLSRELSVLIENQSRLALVLDCILNMLQYHSVNSSSIRNYLRNNINPRHVDHFIHELWTFARSPYDMIGFDETAEYGSYEAHTIELPPSPHSVRDDDSDVVVISSDDSVDSSHETVANEDDNDIDVEGVGEASHLSSISSRSGRHGNTSRHTSQRVQAGESLQDHLYTANIRSQASDVVSSSDSEDCVIVGYVKPLHERTPEIVALDTDEDVIEEQETSCETTANSNSNKINDNNSNKLHSSDTVSPVASTSGSQREMPDSTAGCSNYIPDSVKSSRVHQHKEKKVRSSRSRVKINKKPTRAKSSQSSSSSPFSPVGLNRSKQLIYSSSDTLSSSPIRRRRSKGKRLKKLPYSSDSSSGSSRRCRKARVSNLSKLSCSSDSLSKSPVRHHISKERESSRYAYNSGRSSLDDYSYPLASRISVYSSPYSSDDESIFGTEHKPKLRSIVIPKQTSTSNTKGVSYPSTSSTSSSSVRQHEPSLNPWNLSSRGSKSKHKSRRHDRKKRRRKERYTSSSSSEDFVIRHTKRRSENAVIYSDSD
ncbi:E3 ubiquitin-protein ligase Topors [Schistocerca cancellata]|uniref:E3 ubiquitin-protein ligase Topors n=1 Tax=Schistocerca cancellata TaxID=274614 RepID=UPI0021197915|nr:E3 ubiquitin-protein ligase Topors [Schistocerca cancellata]XP_049787436.1 E3 ubiquitin-protein ligase Topors [Schistocerca cancellata]XP_049787437.1 E3 ubiquitin-protein ligase Topors [Schistocerca cancellata]XP_049787438.1 E3 ubiquitin-protein ligase Topors [Schistocerca cancellata]XP_049787439.1 E3 ubiquitin-protein ligase Topors [Schistocerca cancellata]